MDAAHVATDKEIAKIQRHLARIYARARKELSADMRKWAKSLRDETEKLLRDIENAENENARRTAKNAYVMFLLKAARSDKIARKSAALLYAANKDAADYINRRTANIYAENYNQIGRELQDALDGYDFSPVSESDADRYGQITRQAVDEQKDRRWNEHNILTALAGAALLAWSVDKATDHAVALTVKKNIDSGNRQASDMLTDAESKGRLDSMYRAYDEGFDSIQKEWICVFDNRTRDTHIEYNDIGAVNLDYEYADGLKRPRDAHCSIMAEVCNCRCALVTRTGLAKSGTRAARWYKENGDEKPDRTGFENLVSGSYKKPYSFRQTETVSVSNMTYKEWMAWRSR